MSSNDFHSLLSVFRDATGGNSNGSNKPPRGRSDDNSSSNENAPKTSECNSTTKNNSFKTQTRQKESPQEEREENTKEYQRCNYNSVDSIDPTSTTDPNFSAPILKGRLERLLKVQQIRLSSVAASGNGASSSKSLSCLGKTGKKEVCVAICATIVDEFPHEEMWRRWMENTGGDMTLNVAFGGNGSNVGERTIQLKASAELFIHAKNPEKVRSEWLR